MNIYTVIVKEDGSVEILTGFSFKKNNEGDYVLNDELINLYLGLGHLETCYQAKNEKCVILTGFVNKHNQELVVAQPMGGPLQIVIHIKIRMTRKQIPCIIHPSSRGHFPLMDEAKDQFTHSAIFSIEEGKHIKLAIGQQEFLLSCKNGELRMNDVTVADWPEPAKLVEPAKKKRRFAWLNFGHFLRRRGLPHNKHKTKERVIHSI